MNWKLLVAKSAKKELVSLPSNDQIRLERALEALQDDPFSGDIKRLQPFSCAGVLAATGFSTTST